MSGLEQELLFIDSSIVAVKKEVEELTYQVEEIGILDTSVKGLDRELVHYNMDLVELQRVVKMLIIK